MAHWMEQGMNLMEGALGSSRAKARDKPMEGNYRVRNAMHEKNGGTNGSSLQGAMGE